jgi:bla regulator protein BlaR1
MIAELANHLWQSTLFAFAAGGLCMAFRRNRAQVRYWLWFSATCKFLIPLWVLMSMGTLLERTPSVLKIGTVSGIASAVIEISEPFPDAVLLPRSSRTARHWVPVALLFIWASGFAGVALIRFRACLRIRAVVHSSVPINIPSNVEIRSSVVLLEPGVVGWLRPILLLPEGIFEHLTPHQLEAVLAHELCHVRRRDNLTSAIHMIVEAVFWFHPLVWWVGAQLVRERERACDEDVLSAGSEPHDYATAILSVCKLYVGSPLACVSGVSGSNLKERIHAILTGHIAADLSLANKGVLAVAGIAALAAPVILGIIDAPLISAQSVPPDTPKFDVASIKPCKGSREVQSRTAKTSPGRMTTPCELLTDDNNLGLIQRAYVAFAGGHPNAFGVLSIKGGPSWIRSEMYRIEATAEGNPKSEVMQGPMLQAFSKTDLNYKFIVKHETDRSMS